MTMRPYGRNAKQLLTALQAYADEIEELIEALPQHEVSIASQRGCELVEAAGKLKAAVKHDYQSSQKYHREEKFSAVERAFWAMFPHKLFVALQKLNLSTRPGPNWLPALLDAQHETQYTTAGVREWISVRGESSESKQQ